MFWVTGPVLVMINVLLDLTVRPCTSFDKLRSPLPHCSDGKKWGLLIFVRLHHCFLGEGVVPPLYYVHDGKIKMDRSQWGSNYFGLIRIS